MNDSQQQNAGLNFTSIPQISLLLNSFFGRRKCTFRHWDWDS